MWKLMMNKLEITDVCEDLSERCLLSFEASEDKFYKSHMKSNRGKFIYTTEIVQHLKMIPKKFQNKFDD